MWPTIRKNVLSSSLYKNLDTFLQATEAACTKLDFNFEIELEENASLKVHPNWIAECEVTVLPKHGLKCRS